MSSIRLAGVTYDMTEAINGAAIGDLKFLKRTYGLSVKTIQEVFSSLETVDDNFDGIALLDDDVFLDNIQAVIWLTHRKQGERDFTFEQAGEVSFRDIQIIDDDEVDEVDAGPKDELAPVD
jgi:hypothetical protein